MAITIHSRHEQVSRAGIDIMTAVADAVKKYDLTYGELTAILARELAGWAKYQIRDERKDAEDSSTLSRSEEHPPAPSE